MQKSTVVLLLATAVLAATTLWSWRAFVGERVRADSLQARIEFERIWPAAATPEAPNAAPPENGGPDETGQNETPSPATDLGNDEARMLQNESYREARRRFRQLELASGHIDLAKVLGISRELADRLLALLVDQELRYLSQDRRNPRNEKERAARQLENQLATYEHDREIAALIGEAKLPEWKDYQASLPVRHLVHQLGSKLFALAEPLRADQVEPLISSIHAEREWLRQELADYAANLTWTGGMEEKSRTYRNEKLAELTKTANERIHAAASSILSSTQVRVLDDMMQHERELLDARNEKWRQVDQISGGTG